MKQKPHEWTPLHILPNAKCRQLFEADRMALWDYDIAGEESEPRAARLADGVDVCLSCTEVDDCHRWAMDNEPVVSGVWGGQIFVPMEDRSRFVKCEKCSYPVFGIDKRHGINAGRTPICVKCASNSTPLKKLC